jgi:hypothetical protein
MVPLALELTSGSVDESALLALPPYPVLFEALDSSHGVEIRIGYQGFNSCLFSS